MFQLKSIVEIYINPPYEYFIIELTIAIYIKYINKFYMPQNLLYKLFVKLSLLIKNKKKPLFKKFRLAIYFYFF